MDASAFSSLIEQCADGATEALRVAADRAIVADVFARMQTSGFDYGVTLDGMLTDARGGPDRAALHYHFGRDKRPNPIAYGSGTIVALPGTTAAPVGAAIDWLAPATRRFRLRNWASAGGGSFELEAVHEEQTAPPITLAPGSYHLELSADVWSASQAENLTLSIRVVVGASVLTQSLTRPNAAQYEIGDPRRPFANTTMAVRFETSVPVTVASTSVLTLVNPTASDQRALGLLRVVPA